MQMSTRPLASTVFSILAREEKQADKLIFTDEPLSLQKLTKLPFVCTHYGKGLNKKKFHLFISIWMKEETKVR